MHHCGANKHFTRVLLEHFGHTVGSKVKVIETLTASLLLWFPWVSTNNLKTASLLRKLCFGAKCVFSSVDKCFGHFLKKIWAKYKSEAGTEQFFVFITCHMMHKAFSVALLSWFSFDVCWTSCFWMRMGWYIFKGTKDSRSDVCVCLCEHLRGHSLRMYF